jgi:hypothetical protein
MVRVAVAFIVAASTSGCYLSHERGAFDAAPDAPATTPDARRSDGRVPADVPAPDTGEPVCDGGVIVGPAPDVPLDLLFVVDSSGSMQEEQRSLIDELPRLVTVLASGDLDADGEEDFTPVRSLSLGVITTDLGGGPAMGAGCPPFGDDGLLQTGRTPPPTGCDDSYPPFLFWAPGTEITISEIAHRLGCVADVGTRGCGIEQPLEAALKALTPSSSPIRFASMTRGHGDGANAGFRRPDALLAIILITDEDDCSIDDLELFDPSSTRFAAEPRCFLHEAAALHPIARYLEGFRRLEPDPDRLVFAAITGVPADLISPGTAPDYDAILADPRMVKRVDPDDPLHLVPSCDDPLRGIAEPPRRIVQLARELGESGTVQSICQPRFDGALTGIIARLSRAISRVPCDE